MGGGREGGAGREGVRRGWEGGRKGEREVNRKNAAVIKMTIGTSANQMIKK